MTEQQRKQISFDSHNPVMAQVAFDDATIESLKGLYHGAMGLACRMNLSLDDHSHPVVAFLDSVRDCAWPDRALWDIDLNPGLEEYLKEKYRELMELEKTYGGII